MYLLGIRTGEMTLRFPIFTLKQARERLRKCGEDDRGGLAVVEM